MVSFTQYSRVSPNLTMPTLVWTQFRKSCDSVKNQCSSSQISCFCSQYCLVPIFLMCCCHLSFQFYEICEHWPVIHLSHCLDFLCIVFVDLTHSIYFLDLKEICLISDVRFIVILKNMLAMIVFIHLLFIWRCSKSWLTLWEGYYIILKALKSFDGKLFI